MSGTMAAAWFGRREEEEGERRAGQGERQQGGESAKRRRSEETAADEEGARAAFSYRTPPALEWKIVNGALRSPIWDEHRRGRLWAC